MSNNRKWSEQEDLVLLRQVKAYPQNLKRAFVIASEELDRTTNACMNRWYTVVSKKEDKMNTCFLTISKERVGRNRKNCSDIIEESRLSKWRRILNIIFE